MRIFNLVLAVISLLVVGCSSRTDISEIRKHPRDYVGKEVDIKGQVVDVFSLTFFSTFTLKDETDSIRVFTSKLLPSIGEELEVKGEVKYQTLGTKSMLSIVEKSDDK